ncbi:MAG: response regulator transcription factor [Candidatus Manganitrophus sp. SB1]|nr:response regulator transcription factor [Candidatus Manganitrophus morganii]
MSTLDKESVFILLVEDNPLDVDLIRHSLEKGGISNLLHIARDGREAIDFLHQRVSLPGVLILDINLPTLSGIDVLREAKKIDSEIVAIMLTGQASLDTAVQSLRREGAFDYLEKSKDDLPQLVEAVRLAIEKRALQLQNRWIVQIEGRMEIVEMKKVQETFHLSEREIDVVKCLCRGDANKEIADHLFISAFTVKDHLKKIYQKMGVHNRAALVSKILSNAMLDTAPRLPEELKKWNE